jgi:hypothetical protein
MRLCWYSPVLQHRYAVRVSPRAFFIVKDMKLKPKNWDKFQHYRDRCPPWIKLHRDILNDRIFAGLPIASKALAPLLWLLASESKDGEFDAASNELAFRLHIAIKDIEVGLKPLIDNGFFIDASTMLAPCYQPAIPEREGERETETEKKSVAVEIPDWLDVNDWKDFIAMRKKIGKPMTDRAMKIIISKLEKMKDKGISTSVALQNSIVSGWQDVYEPKVQQTVQQKDWWMNDRRIK